MSNISAAEFNSLTKEYFNFLTHEYGFQLKKNSDLNYDFFTSNTKLSVFLEYNTLVVGIEPIGEEARKLLRNNILPEQISVSVVARSLHPNIDYKIIWDEPISLAMERISRLVKSYCVDFLHGDFTKWIEVINVIKKRKI